MIIKYSLTRLSVIFLLVIIFPLIQKQWLNLYLFDANNFSIYKVLYFLSGLIIPIVIVINSISNFTFYKFNKKKSDKNIYIRGKSLFFITSSVLFILSILISSYILINLNIFFDLFIRNNIFSSYFDINKIILILLILSISLLFRNLKFFIKKALLVNFFMISIIIWYSELTNNIVNNSFIINIFNLGNINFINLFFLLSIELFYFLWLYISDGTHLSDWRLPVPYKSEIASISNIIFFYLLIFLYYFLLL